MQVRAGQPPGDVEASADDEAPLAAWVVCLPDEQFHRRPLAPGQRLSLAKAADGRFSFAVERGEA